MILKEPIIRKILGKVEINTIIKKIQGKKLKQTEKNYLYRSIRPKLLAAKMLSKEEILDKINKRNTRDCHLIEYNLSLYGYDLLVSKSKKAKKLPLEELISQIIIKYPFARYIEAIPIILIKNRIDKFKLLEVAIKYEIKNKIGYLLETAMMIKNLPYLNELLLYLLQNKETEIEFLTEGDYEFLIKTSPKRIKKWNLLGRFFDTDFIKNSKVYL